MLHSWVIAHALRSPLGKALLHELSKYGLECAYTLINGVSYIMKEVSKVFLGAHTMNSNGTVVSRVGPFALAAAPTIPHTSQAQQQSP